MVAGLDVCKVHNLAAQKLKPLGRQGFSEEIRVVVVRVDQWYDNLLGLDHVSDEEVLARDVL